MTADSGLLLWTVGALTGGMVFFAAVVAPLVFRALQPETAGAFLRAFFPRYYLWGLVLAVTAAAIAAVADRVSAVLCILVALLFAYSRQWLMPRINAARDAAVAGDARAERRFARLHRSSVAINLIQLAVLLGIAVRLIW